jgi:hypothetical protein
MQQTITEALQSIKTSAEKIAKKRREIAQRVTNDSRMVDPLANKGGTAEYIRQELQAIADLEANIVKARLAIQAANQQESITVGGIEHTVAGWLVWRREIAGPQETFFGQVSGNIQKQRTQVAGLNRTQTVPAVAPNDLTVYINEKTWAENHESLGEILGLLDGRLSAFNATHTIEV